jgi:hypothetical protein
LSAEKALDGRGDLTLVQKILCRGVLAKTTGRAFERLARFSDGAGLLKRRGHKGWYRASARFQPWSARQVNSSEQSAQQTNEAKSTLHFQTLPALLSDESDQSI